MPLLLVQQCPFRFELPGDLLQLRFAGRFVEFDLQRGDEPIERQFARQITIPLPFASIKKNIVEFLSQMLEIN